MKECPHCGNRLVVRENEDEKLIWECHGNHWIASGCGRQYHYDTLEELGNKQTPPLSTSRIPS